MPDHVHETDLALQRLDLHLPARALCPLSAEAARDRRAVLAGLA